MAHHVVVARRINLVNWIIVAIAIEIVIAGGELLRIGLQKAAVKGCHLLMRECAQLPSRLASQLTLAPKALPHNNEREDHRCE